MKIKLCVQRRWRRPLLFSMEIFPFCGFRVSLFHLTATVAVVVVVTSSHLQVEFIFLFSSFVLGRGFPEREKNQFGYNLLTEFFLTKTLPRKFTLRISFTYTQITRLCFIFQVNYSRDSQFLFFFSLIRRTIKLRPRIF